MDSFYSDWEAQIKKEEEKYYKEVEQEKDRVKNMTCPCCKSTDKQHFVQSENNGVMGSGYSSWVIQSYYVCMSCGIHYSDLSSKEIEKPYSLKNRFF
jgi:C4-type Zn-finger protein